MPQSTFRLTQWFCVLLTLVGLLPWAATAASLVYRAIESPVPLTMSVAAWLAMLVPLWVAWFGVLAWSKRDETALPAVMMTLPIIVCIALFFVIPDVVAG
jgi:hypothetical protein